MKIAFNAPSPLLNNFKAAKQQFLKNEEDSQDALDYSFQSMCMTPIHLDRGSQLIQKVPYEELYFQECY